MSLYWNVQTYDDYLMDTDESTGWHYAEIRSTDYCMRCDTVTDGNAYISWWPIPYVYDSSCLGHYPTREEARRDLEDAPGLKNVPIKNG